MVKESTHLAKSFCTEDWASLCFVTSDMGLQGRLISHANANTNNDFVEAIFDGFDSICEAAGVRQG